jgi:hypothetical protein
MTDKREDAIEHAARHIYADKAKRLHKDVVGWDAEPEEIKDEWRKDVRATIDAYESKSYNFP